MARGGNNIQYANKGTLFEIDNTGHEQVLHGFTGGSDGVLPSQDLYMDDAGNIFGTIQGGEGGGRGVVFELSP